MGAAQGREVVSTAAIPIEYIIRRIEDHPTFSVSVAVPFGSQHMPGGGAALLQRMVQQGTAAYPHPDSVDMALDSVGATLHTHCSPSHSLYTLNSPRQHACIMVRILSEILLYPLLEEAQFDIQSMIFEEDTHAASRRAANQWRRWLQVDAEPQSGLQLSQLQGLWAQHHRVGEMSLMVHGDWEGSEDTLFGWLRHYFGPLAASGRTQGDSEEHAGTVRTQLRQRMLSAGPEHRAADLALRDIPAYLHRETPAGSPHLVVLAYPLEIRYSSPEHFALLVLSDVLGGGKGSRLKRRARECRAWAQAIESRTEIAPPPRRSWLVVCATVSENSCASTTQSLLQAISTFWKAITASEIDHSVQRLASRLDMELTQAHPVARRLSRHFVHRCSQMDGIRWERDQLIATEHDTVRELARSCLGAGRCRMLLSAPRDTLAGLARQLAAGTHHHRSAGGSSSRSGGDLAVPARA